jgi:hypothetical protein
MTLSSGGNYTPPQMTHAVSTNHHEGGGLLKKTSCSLASLRPALAAAYNCRLTFVPLRVHARLKQVATHSTDNAGELFFEEV